MFVMVQNVGIVKKRKISSFSIHSIINLDESLDKFRDLRACLFNYHFNVSNMSNKTHTWPLI